MLRPLQHLKNTQGITFSVVTPNNKGQITADSIKKEINKDTYLIIVNHTSNVTGATSDITQIGKLAKQHHLLFLVDGAQSAGHEKINVVSQNINMLALAGHKGLLGPQGSGALITNHAPLNPIKFGGTGTSSESITQPTSPPEGFESGTLSTANIIALGKGVEYVNKHFYKINQKIYNITNYLLQKLKEIPQITVYSQNARSGVVSFTLINYDNNEVINTLNKKYIIAVRGGLHCAPLIHKHLNSGGGLIRASINYTNTKWQIHKLLNALKHILNKGVI